MTDQNDPRMITNYGLGGAILIHPDAHPDLTSLIYYIRSCLYRTTPPDEAQLAVVHRYIFERYHIIPYRRNLKLKNLIGASIKQNRNGSWTIIVTYCV